MYRFFELNMNSGRKTEIVDEELEDNGTDEENDFFYDEDSYDDDEPYERDYCD